MKTESDRWDVPIPADIEAHALGAMKIFDALERIERDSRSRRKWRG